MFVSERLLLDTLRRLTHGYLHQSHCGATYHNLCVLRDAGFERATVLVRDPRDSTVSWTHHLRAMGPGMVNFNSLIQYFRSTISAGRTRHNWHSRCEPSCRRR